MDTSSYKAGFHIGPLYYIVNIVIPLTLDMYTRQKKRNVPFRITQLSGRSQGIGQFSLYQFKGMSGTAALHVFCNQASKLC